MESKRNILFDKLIKENANAYIKFQNDLVLIYTDFLDFEAVRTSIQYFKSGKMKFEIVNGLPILLNIDNTKDIFDILYHQLITELTPNFKSIEEQISYILLLEQLTGGNSLEIQEMVKSITFDPIIYTLLVDYGFNVLNYVNKNIRINKIISAFLCKYRLLVGNYRNDHNKPCKYDLKCRSHYDTDYICNWQNHSKLILSNNTRLELTDNLFKYNILFLGEKEKFSNQRYFESNYDFKILTDDRIIYDIIFENSYAFAINPQKFRDRDEYEYKDHDKYDEMFTITANNKLIKIQKVSLFKPYKCCGSIFYHIHGH